MPQSPMTQACSLKTRRESHVSCVQTRHKRTDFWKLKMTTHMLLFVLTAFSGGALTLVSGDEAVVSTEDRRVLTTSGKECKFPFRQGGRLHHHCITVLTSKPWCSLTHNYDRDKQLGYCLPSDGFINRSHDVPDPCLVNPCWHGGICTPIPQTGSFTCSCPEGLTGRLCKQRKCYETLHLHYYDVGETWGRIHLRNVEQCTCVAGGSECQRVRYTTCHKNPCQNLGTCRLISATGQEVCHCRNGYGGPRCSLQPETECYTGRGTGYRGVVGTTVSGARCLPWSSDLLFDELHVGTVVPSAGNGLGEHAFCRNPDGDKMPWCYTVADSAISWEYCAVPSCVMPVSSSQRIILFNVLPSGKKPNASKLTNSPVCGTKHKKRLVVARGRIFGGTSALPGTHPWMAAIYIGQSDFCAGSLISSCWIVTAAHCFFRKPVTITKFAVGGIFNHHQRVLARFAAKLSQIPILPLKSQIRVVLGQHHFNVTGPNTQTFAVENYFFPKQFIVFNPTLHDIVLIKLKKQDGRCVRKTPFIRPICLPDKNTTFSPGYCCTISGWGHVHEKASSYSTLQEAGVRLISDDICRDPKVYGHHVTTDMICAGLSGCVDACQGDSGGPLACATGDVSFLYGIISWGEGCGRPGRPGVYTKVVNYIDWINSVIKPKPRTL